MGTDVLVCSRCGKLVPRTERYCTHCGEPVDPKLVDELQSLYTQLRVFEKVIADGAGERTVVDLHAAYLQRYLELRRGPAIAAPITVPLTPNTHPSPLAAPTLAGSPSSIESSAASPAPTPSPATTPVRVAAAMGFPGDAGAGAAPASAGPVFSWRHFVAEQAIAIMAYLGGFLLLVATLAFVVGAWQALPDPVKLIGVVVVYAVFGVFGFALRNSARLRTVGRVYLGVFALMTPLVALALYRFELQHIPNFPISGMICLSAAYAAIIYLALAWRTQFMTYAYLGWTSLGVAGLAIVSWVEAPREWAFFVLGGIGIVLLLPYHLRRIGRVADFATIAAEPALQLGALASGVAAVGTFILAATNWGDGAAAPRGTGFSQAAVAMSACVLVPLAVGWSISLRSRGRADSDFDRLIKDIVDGLIAAFAAQAVMALASWMQASSQTMAVLLGVLALAECVGVFILRSAAHERTGLRWAILFLAFALGSIGVRLVAGDAPPNWPLIVALTATLIVIVAAAIIENVPWLLLVAGPFLTFDYNTLVRALFLPSASSEWFAFSTFEAALALGLWGVALSFGLRRATRRFAPPVYVVAFGVALYVLPLLVGHSARYQTATLVLFALAALIAGRRERQPEFGGLTTGLFGILAVLPFLLNQATARNGWIIAAVILVPAVAALIIRRGMGRVWAYAPYAVALFAAVLGGVTFTFNPHVSTAQLSMLGIPFAVWILLADAGLALVASLWEDQAWAPIFSALLALWALVITRDHVAAFVLVLALAGIGAALRQLRGHWWNVAFHAAAILGSLNTVGALSDLGLAAANWRVAELLAFAVVAYILCIQERSPAFTAVSTLYALGAIHYLPGPDRLTLTLVITFGCAALGVALSRLVGRNWALAVYGIAVEASILASFRIVPPDAGRLEALLLIFAVIAYAIAILERQPWAALGATLYAAWAVLAQPDAHALLPLALCFAVLGLVIGRILGPRWSWPAYTAAAIATAYTAITGESHPVFEAGALAALALAAYLVVVIESRADALPLPFVLGALALAATTNAFHWATWQSILSYSALGWLYFSGAWLWVRLPTFRSRGPMWWMNLADDLPETSPWRDVRQVGLVIHRWSGLLVGVGAVVAAFLSPESFSPHTSSTETVVIALLALAGLLGIQGRTSGWRLAWYIAGELVALACTWQARWLGADNTQAFILAPASYQILIGALIASDERLGRPVRAGQILSLIGSLLLLLPTLSQSFQVDPNWLYALLLAVESLVIVGAGVGTRSRLLVLTGSIFIGAAALRGAALAVNSGVPIALVIGAVALMLLGGATWLSLRARREAHQ